MHRLLAALALTLAVLPSRAALAQSMEVAVDAACDCTFSFHARGKAAPDAAVTITFWFLANGTVVNGVLGTGGEIKADAAGNFAVDLTGLPMGNVDCSEGVALEPGTATFTYGGPAEAGPFALTPVAPQTCEPPVPPGGVTFELGPSALEGTLLIRPGDWIAGGYSFKFTGNDHADETVTVASLLTVPFRCADGTTGEFTLDLGMHEHPVAAGDNGWQPTNRVKDVLSWAGSGLAPAGCGPGALMETTGGVVLTATVWASPGTQLEWRFKYRDPNAKGKGNVNCLDTSDPRRARPDVCAAAWTEAVRAP